jgi:hypothetical protein
MFVALAGIQNDTVHVPYKGFGIAPVLGEIRS